MNLSQGIIVLTGPESTGKSTLANYLSAQLNLPLLGDVSRAYVDDLQQSYTEADVWRIAELIIEQEQAMLKKAPVFISDNCLFNMMIWLRYYHWQVPDWLLKAATDQAHKRFLLCATDIAWVADEQRKNEHDRHLLMQQFVDSLEQSKSTYKAVSGTGQTRMQMAIDAVKLWFPEHG